MAVVVLGGGPGGWWVGGGGGLVLPYSLSTACYHIPSCFL